MLLIARDLLLHDPPRVLAWRLLHDPRLASLGGWLGALLPRASPGFDRDPIALLLAGLAAGLALVYLSLAVLEVRSRWRAAVIGLAAVVLVVLPSVAFMAMGFATERPYGQDGGVVQLPLALDKLLSGHSPYGADYSDSILGQQARSSAFWEPFGGNPILHHHAYLPGTHALMMPFYLAARASFGGFDPRLVTLLAYAALGFLAPRLVEGGAARLAAAGIALLNPLVYWHQIFGANDVLCVVLVVAALLAARDGRLLLAGLALGLACATKQLVWPFAPFLLLHWSGARGWVDLGERAVWRRIWPALAAALLTFAAVVGPIVALDPKAFYGDIVAYNVGLPGADNYPLGGTPGFGIANLLIYFGRVASLRDYFPFSRFYLLLIPLGVALVHRQLRERDLGSALLNGNVALLASLYFSRVVHANYVIPAALLLPLAALMRRRGADAAVVPLLLLTTALEVVENGVFRPTWDQAVAAGLPRTLTGVLALAAPHAGPGLTSDPLGTGLSGLAAGLAVAYLIATALGASSRTRLAIGAAAVALVVIVPTLVVIGISARTGARAEDEWVVQVPADAGRLLRGISPYSPPALEAPRGREAWSKSFRLEPPRALEADRPLVPPGGAMLGAGLRLVGAQDPRWLTLIGLMLVAIVVGRSLRVDQRPLALGLFVLLPPAVFGATFGSREALVALTLLAGLVAAAWPWPVATGILAAVAAGLDDRAWVVLPFLCVPLLGRGLPWRRVLAAFLVTYAALVLPVVFLDGPAFLSALTRAPDPAPGVGLINIVLYLGAEDAPATRMFLAVAPLLVAAAVIALLRLRGRVSPFLLAGEAALVSLFLAAGASPEAMLVPVGLLGLSLLLPEGEEHLAREVAAARDLPDHRTT